MNRLKLLRNSNGWSQKELAHKIGVSEGSISLYEKEERKPSLDVLIKLSNLFNCSIDYLMGLNDFRDKLIQKIKKEEIIMKLKPVETISTDEAGRLIHKNGEYIRAGLRANRFDFGSAVPPKHEGGKWDYNIILSKFLEYAGIDVKEVIEDENTEDTV